MFPLADDHEANEVTLAIVGGRPGEEPRPSGSAVFIAPGVALTATHVLEDFWEHLDDHGRWEDPEASGDFAVQALQYLPGEQSSLLWHAIAAWHVDAIDIAILQLVPDEDLRPGYRWPYVTLDVAPPSINETVHAVGFPKSEVRYDPATRGWNLIHQPVASHGKVTDVFSLSRDRVLRPYPSFEMELATQGGMSGGPVFDDEGILRGVICSGFELEAGDAPIAYASTLWPSLALPIEPTPYLGLSEGDTRLLHLARDGRLKCRNFESLRLPTDPEQLEDTDFE